VNDSLCAFGQQDVAANDDQWRTSEWADNPVDNESMQHAWDVVAGPNPRITDRTSDGHPDDAMTFADFLSEVFAVEAASVVALIQRIADLYSITVPSCGTFDSTTTKYELACVLIEKPSEALHLGDHDPSGVRVFVSIAEDVSAFTISLSCFAPPTFTRLAVTPQQIVEFNLPTAPPKETDRRSFDGDTTQLEAIDPLTYEAVLAEQNHTKAQLSRALLPALHEATRGRA
jgi:hypothetical protein